MLTRIFEKSSRDEITEYIRSKPTGKYALRIWFFHEFLTGSQLPVNDLTSGNYVDALEAKDYYTVQNGEKSSRHRIASKTIEEELVEELNFLANCGFLSSSESCPLSEGISKTPARRPTSRRTRVYVCRIAGKPGLSST